MTQPKTIRTLAFKETQNLKRYCNQLELQRLNFDLINGNSMNGDCLYGQLTGDQDCYRAIQLICSSTESVICNDPENDGKIVPVKHLKSIMEHFMNGGILATVEGDLINAYKRSMYYLTPLELYVPAHDDPDRKRKIDEIKTWLG